MLCASHCFPQKVPFCKHCQNKCKMEFQGEFYSSSLYCSANGLSRSHILIDYKRLTIVQNISFMGPKVSLSGDVISFDYGEDMGNFVSSVSRVYYALELEKPLEESVLLHDGQEKKITIVLSTESFTKLTITKQSKHKTDLVIQCFDQNDLIQLMTAISKVYLNGLRPNWLLKSSIIAFLQTTFDKCVSTSTWLEDIEAFKVINVEQNTILIELLKDLPHTEHSLDNFKYFISDHYQDLKVFCGLLCLSDIWNFGIEEKMDIAEIKKQLDVKEGETKQTSGNSVTMFDATIKPAEPAKPAKPATSANITAPATLAPASSGESGKSRHNIQQATISLPLANFEGIPGPSNIQSLILEPESIFPTNQDNISVITTYSIGDLHSLYLQTKGQSNLTFGEFLTENGLSG